MLKHLVAAAIATSSASSLAAERIVKVPASSPYAGAIRVGPATGGSKVRDAVPSDIAAIVFQASKIGDYNVGYWFDRDFRPALKASGMLARKPEEATYELTAEIRDLHVEPTATGTHHRSTVTFRLSEAAGGRRVWEREVTTDREITRGIRLGQIGRAMGTAAGGALTGQKPAVTAAIIGQYGGPRPIDVMIDLLEGISEGFEAMATIVVADVAGRAPPLP